MAKGFRSFTSAIIPLAAENVDTDQIVPARSLKVTHKEGLAEALHMRLGWQVRPAAGSELPPAFCHFVQAHLRREPEASEPQARRRHRRRRVDDEGA